MAVSTASEPRRESLPIDPAVVMFPLVAIELPWSPVVVFLGEVTPSDDVGD